MPLAHHGPQAELQFLSSVTSPVMAWPGASDSFRVETQCFIHTCSGKCYKRGLAEVRVPINPKRLTAAPTSGFHSSATSSAIGTRQEHLSHIILKLGPASSMDRTRCRKPEVPRLAELSFCEQQSARTRDQPECQISASASVEIWWIEGNVKSVVGPSQVLGDRSDSGASISGILPSIV